MKDASAIYLGKIVSKKNFRVYTYSPRDTQKLVETWEEYEAAMATGLWFATKEDALAAKAIEEEKPKTKTRAVKPKKELEEKKEDEPKIGVLGEISNQLEVKHDDFLPIASE